MKRCTVVESMKKKPPSRERYDKKCPVVSIRVPEKVYRRLQETTKKTGMSYADVLKVGLGLAEVKVRPQEEVRRDAYDGGMLEGFKVAEDDCKVTYRCSICRKLIELDTPEEKTSAARYMTEHGWGHAECHERTR